MRLDEAFEARRIIRRAGIDPHPSAYSGRGATSSDLDDEKLEAIYTGIHQGHCKEAADQYAKMVGDIPVLSATDFLLNIYRLQANDWVWDKALLGDEKGIFMDNEGSAAATLIDALAGGPRRDQTADIRYEFLNRHDIEQPEEDARNPLGW